MFVVSFVLPIIVMVLMISENNKLVVSQFLMLFTAVHTFGANVVMPILQNIRQKQ